MSVDADRSSSFIRLNSSGTSIEKSWSMRTLGPIVPAEDSQPS